MARRQTPFEKRLAEHRSDPAYDEAFTAVREAIDATDAIIRALDNARIEANISKAELARRIGVLPETLRRLFTGKGQNPTAVMLTKLADATDCELRVVPKKAPSSARSPRRVPAHAGH